MTKTQDEINALKQNWARDPCWDIETTEGFEDHKAELLEFRRMTEIDWKIKRDQENQAKKDKWYQLKINESFTLPNGDWVLRVPGGWVLQTFDGNANTTLVTSSVFIPFTPPDAKENAAWLP